MKVIHKNIKAGDIKVQVQHMDDLWYLSHVIEPEDMVKGKTFRKLKLGSEENIKVVKKPVFLEVEVERVEFHRYTNSLRVSGVVRGGSEDVSRGSYHTFDVSEGTILTIKKKKWLRYQLDKINEAMKEKHSKILICAMERDNASFALLKQYGYDYLGDLQGDVEKKGDESKKQGKDFYGELVKQLKEYSDRFEIERLVIGSPAFWKEDLMKVLKKKEPGLASKVIVATCNDTGKPGINELLKREEVKTALSQERAACEIRDVDDLLKEIAKQGAAAYGLKETKEAAEAGAVKTLLVTDALIHKTKEEGSYSELDAIMQAVDRKKGEVVIVSEEHEGGEKLKGLGGIGALLRYKVNY
ncbi:MAG: mRNA surveillance protein pelota [Candidatus Woesearchaeota archaeon]